MTDFLLSAESTRAEPQHHREVEKLAAPIFPEYLEQAARVRGPAPTGQDAPLRDRHRQHRRVDRKAAPGVPPDYLSIGSDDINCLGSHFSTDEIVEIAVFTALMVVSGRLAYAPRAF